MLALRVDIESEKCANGSPVPDQIYPRAFSKRLSIGHSGFGITIIPFDPGFLTLVLQHAQLFFSVVRAVTAETA